MKRRPLKLVPFSKSLSSHAFISLPVHQGNWHGDVAIKILDMENMEEEGTLEAFKLDVATFRKTRHENLILFMGACMNPPKLAIVTSLCKGDNYFFLPRPCLC